MITMGENRIFSGLQASNFDSFPLPYGTPAKENPLSESTITAHVSYLKASDNRINKNSTQFNTEYPDMNGSERRLTQVLAS
jgi:hypothetical protein